MAGKEFPLCSTCAERQKSDGADAFTHALPRGCFICRGLTLRVPAMERRVVRKLRQYQFKTFSVGMIIPAEVQEREDRLRSDLQIRGMETIKSQTAKEIADFVSKETHKRVDRRYPELTLLVDLDRDEVSATSKSVFVYGRYTKPRGVSQRREFCERCSGRGCGECRDGYADIPSIEEVLGRRFTRTFRSPRAKFTWIGSEDMDSAVYPPGRPFVVEMKDPRLRKTPARLTLATGRGMSKVTGVKVLRGKPTVIPSFTFRTRAFVEPRQREDGEGLPRVKNMKGLTVEYRNNKGKTVYKKVYSIHLEKKGKALIAEMKLDGGLPVKRFISGESTTPSLSELLNVPLTCQRFDILKVWETGPLVF